MKFNIKYTIAALSVFMFTAGCDDKLDAIDVIGYRCSGCYRDGNFRASSRSNST